MLDCYSATLWCKNSPGKNTRKKKSFWLYVCYSSFGNYLSQDINIALLSESAGALFTNMFALIQEQNVQAL